MKVDVEIAMPRRMTSKLDEDLIVQRVSQRLSDRAWRRRADGMSGLSAEGDFDPSIGGQNSGGAPKSA